MKKYLELFRNGFDETISDKVKWQNRPYVGYSPLAHSVEFTVVPKKITYTSIDGNVLQYPEDADLNSLFGATFIDNIYDNEKGAMLFENDPTTIGENAFATTLLKTIDIPKSVTSIGQMAFAYSCLNSLNIPDTVETLGQGISLLCKDLSKISINANHFTQLASAPLNILGLSIKKEDFIVRGMDHTEVVELFGEQNFIEWEENGYVGRGDLLTGTRSDLDLVNFPSKVKRIGAFALYKSLPLWPDDLGTVTIPEQVVELQPHSFGSSPLLGLIEPPFSTIIIPSSITTLVGGVFDGNSTVRTIVLPEGFEALMSVKEQAHGLLISPDYSGPFIACQNLTSINLPSTLEIIGESSFYYCTALPSITIPAGVTTIGELAFCNCNALTDFNYAGTMEQWNAINKELNWTMGSGFTVVHCSDGDIPVEQPPYIV